MSQLVDNAGSSMSPSSMDRASRRESDILPRIELLAFTSSIALAGSSYSALETLESTVSSQRRISGPDSARKCTNCLSKECYVERTKRDSAACPRCKICKSQAHELEC